MSVGNIKFLGTNVEMTGSTHYSYPVLLNVHDRFASIQTDWKVVSGYSPPTGSFDVLGYVTSGSNNQVVATQAIGAAGQTGLSGQVLFNFKYIPYAYLQLRWTGTSGSGSMDQTFIVKR